MDDRGFQTVNILPCWDHHIARYCYDGQEVGNVGALSRQAPLLFRSFLINSFLCLRPLFHENPT